MNRRNNPAPQRIPTGRPWWRSTPAALGSLVLVAVIGAFSFPLGFLMLIVSVVLMWFLPPLRWFAKLGASVGALVLLTIGAGVGGQLDDTGKGGSKAVADSHSPSPKASAARSAEPKTPDYTGKHLNKAEANARTAGYTTEHHDASARHRTIVLRSGWVVCFQLPGHDDGRRLIVFAAVKDGEPCPKADGGKIPWPTMPDLIGKTWRASVTALTDLGVDKDAINARTHYLNDALPNDHDTWRVCTQDPTKGGDITATVTLELAHPQTGCATHGTYLPDKDDDGRPDYRDRTDDRDTGTVGGGHTSGGSSTSDGGTSTTGGGTSASGGSGGSSTGGGSSGSSTSGGGGGLVVHPGAFCSPAGAVGVTSTGRHMVCGPASDGRNRWHSG